MSSVVQSQVTEKRATDLQRRLGGGDSRLHGPASRKTETTHRNSSSLQRLGHFVWMARLGIGVDARDLLRLL